MFRSTSGGGCNHHVTTDVLARQELNDVLNAKPAALNVLVYVMRSERTSSWIRTEDQRQKHSG
jgi:hypothetical protein